MQYTLPDKDISSRVGQRTKNKKMGQHLSCYPSEIPSHKITSIHPEEDGAMLLLRLGDSVIQSCWADRAAPLAVHYTQLALLSTNINHMRLPQQIPTCAWPKTLLQSVRHHRRLTCFAKWFPAFLPHYFWQHFKACRARLHLMQRARSLCTLGRYAFSYRYRYYFVSEYICSISQSWEMWPFTSTYAATSGAQSGVVEYYGWDFQRRVRGLGVYLLKFFRKKGWIIPLVMPTCKRRDLHMECGKNALRHTANWAVRTELCEHIYVPAHHLAYGKIDVGFVPWSLQRILFLFCERKIPKQNKLQLWINIHLAFKRNA